MFSMREMFRYGAYCTLLKDKKRIFLPNISNCVVQFIISGGMRRERGKLEKKRERKGGEGEKEARKEKANRIT